MKSHISATIDLNLVEKLNRYGEEERRSRSQIIEMALEEFLRKRGVADEDIVTSAGRFVGDFSREETYARE
ncbi:MAG TPA: ribbon-helix-helix protein, CopG family [Opitutaceae bacterium]|nr:ribbon-helix-helix protein, CopG family [Opitutaceae bacterium]